MKITDIKLHWIEIPRSDSVRMGWGINHFRQPYHDESDEDLLPALKPGGCHSMIYEVHTDAGIVGYGEREEPLEISGTSLRSAPCAGGFRTSGKFREVVPAAFERLAAYLSERVGVPPIGHFRESEGTERREGARGDRVS